MRRNGEPKWLGVSTNRAVSRAGKYATNYNLLYSEGRRVYMSATQVSKGDSRLSECGGGTK
jgi:hypothetical protein